MKRKLALGVSVLILSSSIVGYAYWQQYKNSRLQPYHKLYSAIDSQCSDIAPNMKYEVIQTRDLGKGTSVKTSINFESDFYQVEMIQDSRSEFIIFIFKNTGENSREEFNANIEYKYTYYKLKNTLVLPGEKSGYERPTKELISAFEQEMIARLKSC